MHIIGIVCYWLAAIIVFFLLKLVFYEEKYQQNWLNVITRAFFGIVWPGTIFMAAALALAYFISKIFPKYKPPKWL